MIPENLVVWGSSGCSIREIAAYGEQRSAVVGRENVYNFTIGSPSIDPPPCVRQTIDRLMDTMPPCPTCGRRSPTICTRRSPWITGPRTSI